MRGASPDRKQVGQRWRLTAFEIKLMDTASVPQVHWPGRWHLATGILLTQLPVKLALGTLHCRVTADVHAD